MTLFFTNSHIHSLLGCEWLTPTDPLKHSEIATKMNLKDWLRMIKIKKNFAASVNTQNIRRLYLFSWWRSEKLDHIFSAVLINHQTPHTHVVAEEEGEPVVEKRTFEFKS